MTLRQKILTSAVALALIATTPVQAASSASINRAVPRRGRPGAWQRRESAPTTCARMSPSEFRQFVSCAQQVMDAAPLARKQYVLAARTGASSASGSTRSHSTTRPSSRNRSRASARRVSGAPSEIAGDSVDFPVAVAGRLGSFGPVDLLRAPLRTRTKPPRGAPRLPPARARPPRGCGAPPLFPPRPLLLVRSFSIEPRRPASHHIETPRGRGNPSGTRLRR